MQRPRRRSRRLVVNTDASWSAGVAALAVAGHVASHCQLVQVRSPTIAEAEALLFAMTVLAGGDLGRPVLFRTDNQGVVRMVEGCARVRGRHLIARIDAIQAHLAGRRHWRVRHVHRSVVHDAHALAHQALRAHLQQGAA